MITSSVERLIFSILAFCLSLSWLLPNHYPPWMSFHSESFASLVLLLASALIFVRAKGKVAWTWPTLFLVAICLIPWVQLLAGKIHFLGTAWIHSVFIFGLLVSFVTGYQWEIIRKNQCADFVFFATSIASVISVPIQIYQFLGFEDTIWIADSMRVRPSANLGQPNQLGSLLLLGLLAVIWGRVRGALNNFIGAILVVFLLFGIALTQSRTALLNANLVFIVLAVWAHNRSFNKIKWLLAGFAIYLLVLFFSLPFFYPSDAAAEILAIRMSSEPRLAIWHAFFDAILKSPISGYGWGQIANAQVEIASPFHSLGRLYIQSHNLILDILLWNGLLIGVLIVISAGIFYKKVSETINSLRSLLLMLFIGVLGVHSMLEFPLHYAYFLFPAGMVSGVLASSCKFKPVFFTEKPSLIIVLLMAVVFFFVTTSDYQKTAQSYYDLLSELAGIKSNIKGAAPDVMVLTQMRELILFARFDGSTDMKDSELEWMQDVAKTYPSPNNFQKVAFALALNDKPAVASRWLGYICHIFNSKKVSSIHEAWTESAQVNPLVARVEWPEDCSDTK